MKLVIFFSILFLIPNALYAAKLTVLVNGLKNSKGCVVIGIYRDSKSFDEPRSAFIYRNNVEIVNNNAEISFQLDAGNYAISMFHDENANKDFDLKFRAIPVEGWGFSRDAKPSPFWPDYEDAVFEITDTNKTVTINVKYWTD